MSADCFDSTALPEGAPHLLDRLDAAIADAERWADLNLGYVEDAGQQAVNDLLDVAREARAVLDAEGFGR